MKNFSISEKEHIINGIKISTPVVYPKASAYMGLFRISRKKAYDSIRTNRICPVGVLNQKSLLSITVFDYHASPVGPYREVALSIPSILDPFFSPPVLPLIFSQTFNLGFHTLLLAMNTDMAREHSEKIFGYPTFKNNIIIDINNSSDLKKVITATDGENLVFKITCRTSGKYKRKVASYGTFITKNEEISSVNLMAVMDEAHSSNSNDFLLELGTHPISDMIKSLDIDASAMRSIFYRNVEETLSAPVKMGAM